MNNKERPALWQSVLLALAILLIIYMMSSCSRSGQRNPYQPVNVKSTKGRIIAINRDGTFKVNFEPIDGVITLSEWFYSARADTLHMGAVVNLQ